MKYLKEEKKEGISFYGILFWLMFVLALAYSINYFYNDYGREHKKVTPAATQTLKTEFHIKVVPWGSHIDDWAIHFTNDGWETFTELEYNLDFCSCLHPIYEKEEAIFLAKLLDTYEKCIEYNKKQKRLSENGDRAEILIK